MKIRTKLIQIDEKEGKGEAEEQERRRIGRAEE